MTLMRIRGGRCLDGEYSKDFRRLGGGRDWFSGSWTVLDLAKERLDEATVIVR